jgi:hypothetical protein
VRCIVHGTFLISILFTSFSALGSLPVTIMRPTGVMKFLPWSFYDQLQTPHAMELLKIVMVLSLVLSTAGLLTAVSTKSSLLLVVFYQGLLRSFGHFNHDEMIAIYFLVCSRSRRAAMRFRSISRLGENGKRPAFAYAYPILLMQLLLAWAYFSSALIKLRVAGWKYLSPDNLPALAIFHSLDNLHDTLSARVLVAASAEYCRSSWRLCSSGSCCFRSRFLVACAGGFWNRVCFHVSTCF